MSPDPTAARNEKLKAQADEGQNSFPSQFVVAESQRNLIQVGEKFPKFTAAANSIAQAIGQLYEYLELVRSDPEYRFSDGIPKIDAQVEQAQNDVVALSDGLSDSERRIARDLTYIAMLTGNSFSFFERAHTADAEVDPNWTGTMFNVASFHLRRAMTECNTTLALDVSPIV